MIDLQADPRTPGDRERELIGTVAASTTRMLAHSRAEMLIAFPGGSGTEGCVRIAMGMGGVARVWKWEGGREDGQFVEIGR